MQQYTLWDDEGVAQTSDVKCCRVCGKPLKEKRANYCSRECYGVSKRDPSILRYEQCQICGTTLRKAQHKYCSYACKYQADRLPEEAVLRSCEYCGKQFSTRVDANEHHGRRYHPNARFCSLQCMRDGLSAGPSRTETCLVCGTQFFTRKLIRKYCSKACLPAYREMRKLRRERLWAIKHASITCPTCGRDFQRQTYGQRFCSRQCILAQEEHRKLLLALQTKDPDRFGRKPCPQCGQEFRHKKSHQVYCSKACVSAATLAQTTSGLEEKVYDALDVWRVKYRKQMRIGRYVVDAYIPSLQLILEHRSGFRPLSAERVSEQ